MKDLKNKTAIVTGGSKGIGKGIVEKLAKSGCNVAFTYLSSEESAIEIEKLSEKYNVKIKKYKSDASDFNQSSKLIENILDDFDSYDILINNAGITRDNLILRMDEESWKKVIDINLNSCFNLTKCAIREFMKKNEGVIINISSIVGIKGNAGQSNYSSSKAAIIGFTKSVALELGSRNIRCNAIAPGFIETKMTKALQQDQINEWAESIPLKRSGKPEDVANTTLFLASDMSSYITGQVMNVCGGMLT